MRMRPNKLVLRMVQPFQHNSNRDVMTVFYIKTGTIQM
jgi:hypothetical protein